MNVDCALPSSVNVLCSGHTEPTGRVPDTSTSATFNNSSGCDESIKGNCGITQIDEGEIGKNVTDFVFSSMMSSYSDINNSRVR